MNIIIRLFFLLLMCVIPVEKSFGGEAVFEPVLDGRDDRFIVEYIDSLVSLDRVDSEFILRAEKVFNVMRKKGKLGISVIKPMSSLVRKIILCDEGVMKSERAYFCDRQAFFMSVAFDAIYLARDGMNSGWCESRSVLMRSFMIHYRKWSQRSIPNFVPYEVFTNVYIFPPFRNHEEAVSENKRRSDVNAEQKLLKRLREVEWKSILTILSQLYSRGSEDSRNELLDSMLMSGFSESEISAMAKDVMKNK